MEEIWYLTMAFLFTRDIHSKDILSSKRTIKDTILLAKQTASLPHVVALYAYLFFAFSLRLALSIQTPSDFLFVH